MEIGLIYTGKKKPLQFDNPATGKLKFSPGQITWVSSGAAEWLLKFSPGAFSRAGQRGYTPEVDDSANVIEDAESIVKSKQEADALDDALFDSAGVDGVQEEPEKPESASQFVCPKCKREYKDERWYSLHISKCEG